jgi:hypothetical protein
MRSGERSPRRRLVQSARGDLPERRVGLPELYGHRGRMGKALSQVHDLAFLLKLRRFVDQQKFLSGLNVRAQHQESAVGAHIKRVRFLVKRLLRRAVTVDENRNVHSPSPVPAPIGMRTGSVRRGISLRFFRAILLRLPDCLENAAHIFLLCRGGRLGWPDLERQQHIPKRALAIEEFWQCVRIGKHGPELICEPARKRNVVGAAGAAGISANRRARTANAISV